MPLAASSAALRTLAGSGSHSTMTAQGTQRSQGSRAALPTWPACGMVTSELSGMPGSAGTALCTVWDSTATTPTGMPPSRALPVTTLRAQPA